MRPARSHAAGSAVPELARLSRPSWRSPRPETSGRRCRCGRGGAQEPQQGHVRGTSIAPAFEFEERTRIGLGAGFTCAEPGPAARDVSLGSLGVTLEDAIELSDGASPVALGSQGIALLEMQVELYRVGLEGQLFLLPDRQVVSPHVLEQLRRAAVEGDQAGIQPGGLFVVADGLLPETQPRIDIAAIEQDDRVIGSQPHRLAQIFDRPLVLADHIISQPDICVAPAFFGSRVIALLRSWIARSYWPIPLNAAPRFR